MPTEENQKRDEINGMLSALRSLATPLAPVRTRCVSCDTPLFRNEDIGACDHGLLCDLCRFDNQCLQCKRERDNDEGYSVEEALCICCSHGQHGSHLIGGAKCDCACHPSNQRRSFTEAA